MTEPEGAALGRILRAAVPELRGPEDRMSEVARRLRRKRKNATLAAVSAAVVVTALLVSLPQILVSATGPGRTGAAPSVEVSPPTLGPDGCPVGPPSDVSPNDIPGPFVPTGATSVILCEQIVEGPAFDPQEGQPRVLSTPNVAEMVAQLNLLPTEAQLLAEIRLREEAAGRVLPPDFGFGCTAMAIGPVRSLVLQYPDRTPVVVLEDRNCSTMTATGRGTRYISKFNPIGEFCLWYRDQLAATTDPATVPTPECVSVLPAKQIDPAHVDGAPRDGVARNRVESDPFLPTRLVALAACRTRSRRVAADWSPRTSTGTQWSRWPWLMSSTRQPSSAPTARAR